jgi:hypothetical protein
MHYEKTYKNLSQPQFVDENTVEYFEKSSHRSYTFRCILN